MPEWGWCLSLAKTLFGSGLALCGGFVTFLQRQQLYDHISHNHTRIELDYYYVTADCVYSVVTVSNMYVL